MVNEWGPLGVFVGEWEGDHGCDSSFSHAHRRLVDTEYRERVTFVPCGPVINGRQRLFGLDYRTEMWRGEETTPFHTEVGYWLWDAASGEVLRCFVVPRGINVLAGGTATLGATELSLAADLGDPEYGITENRYLAQHASSLSYRVDICAVSDDEWSYEEVTTLRMGNLSEPLVHADRNTLSRVL